VISVLRDLRHHREGTLSAVGRRTPIRIPIPRHRDIDRVTQARTLNEVGDMTRDLIAIMTGLEHDSFELDVRIQLPDGVRAHLAEVERARDAEAEARSHAATELRAAAAELKNAGLSVRELGAVLRISYQRASRTGVPAERRRAG
jgi:hypothetical protein